MTHSVSSICVFCGSRPGTNPAYALAARHMGQVLAARGIRLVYGGGRVGLMGVLADAALAAGGRVVGVIPEALLRLEVGHRALTELHVVPNMHARKRMMAELSDAFVALPGGIGTFEELFEVWTWRQLGYHGSPLGLLDVDGYYQGLLQFMGRTVGDGFLDPTHLGLLMVDTDSARLVERIAEAPRGPRLDLDQT